MQMTVEGGVGVRGSDGKVMWKDAHVASKTANVNTPNFVNNKVIYTYDFGSSVLLLNAHDGVVTAKELYFTQDLPVDQGGVVMVNGYLYGFSSAVLNCVDLPTGKRVWRDRSVGSGSLIYADGRLYLLSASFTVGLVSSSPSAMAGPAASIEPPLPGTWFTVSYSRTVLKSHRIDPSLVE